MDPGQGDRQTSDLSKRSQNTHAKPGDNTHKQRGIEKIPDIIILSLQEAERAVVSWQFVEI